MIYFIILSLTLLAESWTVFIVGWLPFYSWFRLFFLLYLVLPQTQGAKHIYLTYFEPYIVHHEKQIDNFIGQAHRTLEQLGLGYMNVLVEWIRERILGQASPQPHAAATGTGAQAYASYAADLLSRFAMPAARTQAAPAVTGAAGGVLNMLSSAAAGALAGGVASSNTRSVPASATAASMPDTFISSALHTNMTADQKSSFIGTQRDRLQAMLRQLDKEQVDLDLAYGRDTSERPGSSKRQSMGSSGLHTKSTSQMSFDNIEYDDLHSQGSRSGQPSQGSTPPRMQYGSPGSSDRGSGKRTASGGFLSGWIGGGGNTTHARDEPDDRDYDRYERERDDRYRDDERSDRRSPRATTDEGARHGWTTARDIADGISRPHRGERGRYD